MYLPIQHNGRLSMKCTFRTDDFRNSGDGEGFDFYTFILDFMYYINICVLIDIHVYKHGDVVLFCISAKFHNPYMYI